MEKCEIKTCVMNDERSSNKNNCRENPDINRCKDYQIFKIKEQTKKEIIQMIKTETEEFKNEKNKNKTDIAYCVGLQCSIKTMEHLIKKIEKMK
jgi:hypothetical protein